MNRLQLAREGFASISPELHSALDEHISDRVEAWLRDDIGPVVEELSLNRSFQLTTRWSVDHLSPGMATSERRAVEVLDAKLVEFARNLLDVETQIATDCDPPAESRFGILSDDLETLRYIASRPWFDLVCPEEFFDASSGLNLNPSGNQDSSQRQKHIRAFQRTERRLPLGDYVSRLMFARIEYWKLMLDKILTRLLSSGVAANAAILRNVELVFASHIELEQLALSLRESCDNDPSARVRDACVTLTQSYTAYSFNPNLDWLGCPAGWPTGSAPIIKDCIRRVGVQTLAARETNGSLRILQTRSASLCDPDTVRQIAYALEEVINFYEMPADPEDLINWAVNRARLILVDRSPRQVYWDGRIVADGNWDSSEIQWNLLWTLADYPGRIVDQGMLRRPESQIISSRRNRLSGLLSDCQELDSRIVNRRGQGYLLDLRAQDVILLQDNGNCHLEYLKGGHSTAR